eukprot:3954592-Amphidinium_carterae.1
MGAVFSWVKLSMSALSCTAASLIFGHLGLEANCAPKNIWLTPSSRELGHDFAHLRLVAALEIARPLVDDCSLVKKRATS